MKNIFYDLIIGKRHHEDDDVTKDFEAENIELMD